jgi:hypothetical protein
VRRLLGSVPGADTKEEFMVCNGDSRLLSAERTTKREFNVCFLFFSVRPRFCDMKVSRYDR